MQSVKQFILHILFLCTSIATSNAQNFDWAKSIQGIGLEIGRAVDTDSEGNVVMVGSFTGNAQIGNTSLTGMGQEDAFIAKFTSNGNLLWARVISGPKEDRASGVVIDSDDNIFVVGHFTDTAIFLQTPTVTISASGFGKKDLFVAKYSPNGAFQWFVKGGGSGDDTGTDIDWFQYDGKLVVSGGFEGRAAFGSKLVLSSGLSDAFVLKIDREGNVHWVQTGGGDAHDVAAAVATDRTNGDIYAIGDYYIGATFGDVELEAVGSSDMYLVKYDKDGVFQWIRSNGGTAVDVGTDVGTDLNNKVFVTGYYQGTTTFQNFNSTASGGYNDVFLSKFDSDGNCQWLQSAGSHRLDNSLGLAVAWDGTTFLTGFFDELMVVNGDSIIGNGYDIFILNYSPDGDYRYGRQAGAGSADFGVATCLGPDQSLYVAGYYFFFADFDNVTIGNATNGDGFLARMTNILSANQPETIRQERCFRFDFDQKRLHSTCQWAGRWRVFNALGQQMASGTKASSSIDLSFLVPGYYIFSYEKQAGIGSLPLVIR